VSATTRLITVNAGNQHISLDNGADDLSELGLVQCVAIVELRGLQGQPLRGSFTRVQGRLQGCLADFADCRRSLAPLGL